MLGLKKIKTNIQISALNLSFDALSKLHDSYLVHYMITSLMSTVNPFFYYLFPNFFYVLEVRSKKIKKYGCNSLFIQNLCLVSRLMPTPKKSNIKNTKFKTRINCLWNWSYFAVGFNILFVAPIVFRVMGCERATFHTEV